MEEAGVEALRDWIGVIAAAGGIIGGIALYALIERLRATFISKDQINGLSERIDRDMAGVMKRIDVMEDSMGGFDMRLDSKRERLMSLEKDRAADVRHMTESVVSPLQSIAKRMERMAEIQVKQGEQLLHLADAVTRLERRLDGHQHNDRRP
jgi:hypothetical protein